MPSNVTADGGAASVDPIGWAVGGAVAMAAKNAATLVATYGANSVKVELDTLITFKNRAEELLHALMTSPAAESQMAQQHLQPANLGSGFAESNDLMTAYNRTFTGLQQLIKDLATQIQGMADALGKTAKNYGGTEEDQTSSIAAASKDAGSLVQQATSGGSQYTQPPYAPGYQPGGGPAGSQFARPVTGPVSAPAPAPGPYSAPASGSGAGGNSGSI
ncbi:hypothetical protein [Kitasatospora sp. NBC_00315]|uniref:hypothetical protein n=1 Tax=Kitasatospora sp. NBC_00315 TaxID=2975963 RepID=UPI003249B163